MIVAESATKFDTRDTEWIEGSRTYGGSGRYSFDEKFGFGLINANGAISLAKNWTPVPSLLSDGGCDDARLDVPIDAENFTRRTITLDSSPVEFVEHVEFHIDMTATRLAGVELWVGSPRNSEGGTGWAALVPFRPDPLLFGLASDGRFRYSANLFLGEDASGDWKLAIKNRGADGDSLTLHSWEVVVYGHGRSSTTPSNSGVLNSAREPACGRFLDDGDDDGGGDGDGGGDDDGGGGDDGGGDGDGGGDDDGGGGDDGGGDGDGGGDDDGDDGGGGDDGDGGDGGGGDGGGGDDKHLVAPYWQGTGGFAVRPSDGRSAVVRIDCGGRRYSNREYADDDGLIVRSVSLPVCVGSNGQPVQGEMAFEGIDENGWYWINGDRNVALAPLVRKSALNGELRPPIPDGVSARPAGDSASVRSVMKTRFGTLIVHDATGLMGIIPHLAEMESANGHMVPYWAGGGGIVGQVSSAESLATVRLTCKGTAAEHSFTLKAGEDGIVVSLLPYGCYDTDGQPTIGRLEVEGLEDGAWYWINGGERYPMATAGPLIRGGVDDSMPVTVPVIPAGVGASEAGRGVLLTYGRLMGVVPKLRLPE